MNTYDPLQSNHKQLTQEAIESTIKSFTEPFSAYNVTQKLRKEGYWTPHNECRERIRNWIAANRSIVDLEAYDDGNVIYTRYTLNNSVDVHKKFPYKELQEFRISSKEFQQQCLEMQKNKIPFEYFDYSSKEWTTKSSDYNFHVNDGFKYRISAKPAKPAIQIEEFNALNLKNGEEVVVTAENRNSLIEAQKNGMIFQYNASYFDAEENIFKIRYEDASSNCPWNFDISGKYRRGPNCKYSKTFPVTTLTSSEKLTIKRGQNGKFTIPKHVVKAFINRAKNGFHVGFLERDGNKFIIPQNTTLRQNRYMIDKSGNIRFRNAHLSDCAVVRIENNSIILEST